jgi:hypothetical protein
LKPRRGPSLTSNSKTSSSEARHPSLFPLPLSIIVVAAFSLVAPFFFLGNPSGHDFEFHLNSWMEVSHQWQLAILYPRWAEFAHYCYGEARFLFYPPFSWTLGASLGSLFPWKASAGAYVFLAVVFSGASMFLLAREFFSRKDAVFAAVLYAINPYVIVVVYWRSALAELLGGALLPLLLLWVLRIPQRGYKAAIPLGLIVAAAWLTNAPAAVMVNYSLALLITIVAAIERSPKALVIGALAAFVGAALASFYLLPAAYEQKWVNIAEVLAPGVRPQDNFLFTVLADADHNRFNFLVSIVGLGEIVAFAGAAILCLRFKRERSSLWWLAFGWAAVAILLMLPFTLVAWEHLPKLRFVQLPWRWLLCLNVPVALLITWSFRRWLARALLCLGMLSVLWLVWHRVQPPWWDQALDIQEMQNNIHDNIGYEGTDEYVPAGADPYEIDQKARRVRLDGQGQAQIHVRQWDPESRNFTAVLTQPSKVVLRLFNYPAWKVDVNGSTIAAETQETTGQMVIPLPAGQNEVQITFVRTWDRLAGALVSLLGALSIVALLALRKDFQFWRISQGQS